MPIGGALIGGGIGILGGLLGGSSQAKASRRAEQAQQEGIRKTMGVQQEMYEKMRGLQQPYMEAGQSAAGPLGALMLGQRGVMEDPLAQQQQAMGLDMLRQRFGTGLSSGVESGFTGRLGAIEQGAQRNRLGQLMDIGMGGASGLAGIGQQRSTALANAMMRSQQIAQQAQQQRADIGSQMLGSTVYGLGQIPSMMAMSKYMQGQRQMFGGY